VNRNLYSHLARQNLKKNSRVYLPYILASIGTIMMFYILCTLAFDEDLRSDMYGGGQMAVILSLGIIVVGIFAVIFLLYTNSFLLKRRKKEIGLYNILGLGKRHIAKMMSLETLYVALISLVLGMALGILLSKLMFALMLRMLDFAVPFGFSVSLMGLILTLILFGGIFLLALISNLVQIGRAKPVELMRGSQQGEREPKTKWLLALIGAATLGGGYYIAQTVSSAVDAMGMFFVAVILVIIGTYCLFTAGSIVVLKALRRNKRFYYRTRNFTSVSGMLYRMKQNAVGLANICILSTMVLVMISTTVSLYIGIDDSLEITHPNEIVLKSYAEWQADVDRMNDIVTEAVSRSGASVVSRTSYRYFSVTLTGSELPVNQTKGKDLKYGLTFVSLADYNAIEGMELTLGEGEAIVCGKAYSGDSLYIEGTDFRARVIDVRRPLLLTVPNADIDVGYCVVVSDLDEVFEEVNQGAYADGRTTSAITSYAGIDIEQTGGMEQALYSELYNGVIEANLDTYISLRSEERAYIVSLYGGLLFLGIFLGTLFSMATAMIIYYKQISEGFEDKQRFEIMQKVGMGLSEVRKTIRRQILMVFFLPLVAAVIHIAFAFKMITKMLTLLLISNIQLFALCTLLTVLAFAAVYTVVFGLTARSYYKIVRA
jgi:putative ABC transport system permease protein